MSHSVRAAKRGLTRSPRWLRSDHIVLFKFCFNAKNLQIIVDQDELTIVTDCGNESESVNVTLSGIAEFTLTLTTEAFSIFHDEDEKVLKPWIDIHEIDIDKVRNTHGVLNSSGLIRGKMKNLAQLQSM